MEGTVQLDEKCAVRNSNWSLTVPNFAYILLPQTIKDTMYILNKCGHVASGNGALQLRGVCQTRKSSHMHACLNLALRVGLWSIGMGPA